MASLTVGIEAQGIGARAMGELAAAAAGIPYQLVHFDGHGAFLGRRDADGGEGTLVFEHRDGGADHVTAATLATVLADDELPGGTATGTMLHEILETIPFDSLAAKPSLDDWLEHERIKEVFDVAMARAGITMPCGISAPAATRAPAPTTAPLRMTAPAPTSASSSTVQPCTTALCPTVTPAPIRTRNSLSTWMVTPSWMLDPNPTSMGSASARSVAEYQTLTRAARLTCPIRLALGATQDSGCR